MNNWMLVPNVSSGVSFVVTSNARTPMERDYFATYSKSQPNMFFKPDFSCLRILQFEFIFPDLISYLLGNKKIISSVTIAGDVRKVDKL